MILRLLQSSWQPFTDHLCARRDVESAGLVLAERVAGGAVLQARDLVHVPNDAYLVRRVDQLRLDPVALNRLVRPARDAGLSIFTVHTHPGTTAPWFSQADDVGDGRLMPAFLAQMPGPHGSIVLAGDTGMPSARVWTESGGPQGIALRVVGGALRVIPAASDTRDEVWFDRQRLALGAEGQAILSDLHAVVVGLGGTGSAVLLQLAHLGVGRITLIDGDRVESTNLSRILGATRQDVGVAYKVDVAARYVTELGLKTVVTPIRRPLGDPETVQATEAADLVFSCVDTQTPCALLNRLAYRSAVPVIDMGSAFRVDGAGRVEAGAGRVVVFGPGRPCLACWGHLDPVRLRTEALSSEERACLAQEGYVAGADLAQPSVVAFNTQIAGAAVVEMLRLVTQFAGAEHPPMRLSFDFLTGTVRRSVVARNAQCTICARPAADTHAARLDVRLKAPLTTRAGCVRGHEATIPPKLDHIS